MKIEPEDIKSFQRLWKEQFNADIDEQETQEKAIQLLEMMKSIYKPIPQPSQSKTQLSILDFNQIHHEA